MTIADAFAACPNTAERAALVAAFAAVQSAIADCESKRVFTPPVAAALVDEVVAVSRKVASEVREVPPPAAADPSAEAPAEADPPAEPDTVPVPETEPAEADPPA